MNKLNCRKEGQKVFQNSLIHFNNFSVISLENGVVFHLINLIKLESPLYVTKVANFTTITTTNNGHILIRKAFDSGKLRDYIPKGFWLYKKKFD